MLKSRQVSSILVLDMLEIVFFLIYISNNALFKNKKKTIPRYTGQCTKDTTKLQLK